jgi:FkbM family methyltransferase
MIGVVLRRGYRRLFGGARWYRVNRFLHELSLHGLGILNYENDRMSGERHTLARALATSGSAPVVLDVGANVGNYARAVMQRCPTARVFAFEPHPGTFTRTLAAAREAGFTAINAACGADVGRLTLFDYDGQATGSEHASLYADVIERIHGGRPTGHDVAVTTIDAFVAERGIERVRLLKIDTEGHEAAVLRGARNTLAAGKVDLVQFEFNEMHVASRTFFRDFIDLLPGFRLYRVLPDGWIPLPYSPVTCEIFAFQNIVAVRE